jgi:hypothetical protein
LCVEILRREISSEFSPDARISSITSLGDTTQTRIRKDRVCHVTVYLRLQNSNMITYTYKMLLRKNALKNEQLKVLTLAPSKRSEAEKRRKERREKRR